MFQRTISGVNSSIKYKSSSDDLHLSLQAPIEGTSVFFLYLYKYIYHGNKGQKSVIMTVKDNVNVEYLPNPDQNLYKTCFLISNEVI